MVATVLKFFSCPGKSWAGIIRIYILTFLVFRDMEGGGGGNTKIVYPGPGVGVKVLQIYSKFSNWVSGYQIFGGCLNFCKKQFFKVGITY